MREVATSLIASVLVLLNAATVGAQPEAPAVDERIAVDAPVVALVGVRVIDGTGGPPAEDQTLVIADGRIAALGPSGAVSIPDGAERLELEGRTVLPGLVMLHEHINYFSGRAVWHTQPLSFPPLYLAAGVTTIRTAGSESPTVDGNLKLRIDSGGAVGPRIHLTGPMFNGSAGGFLGDHVLDTPEQARRAVDYWASRGFTSFKVYSEMEPDVLAAVIEAAHAHGLTVAGHLGSVGCREAAALGIDTIEHSFVSCLADLDAQAIMGGGEVDPSDPEIQQLIRDLVAEEVVMVTTPMDWRRPLPADQLDLMNSQARDNYLRDMIAPPEWWPNPDAMAQILKLDHAFVAAGGRLGVGSDPGNTGMIAGFANHYALALLVDAGWEPLEVIRLATSNNAEILGAGDTVGRVAVGFAADLMVLPGDPSQDIRALEGVELVFKAGVGYSPDKLKESVRGKVGWH